MVNVKKVPTYRRRAPALDVTDDVAEDERRIRVNAQKVFQCFRSESPSETLLLTLSEIHLMLVVESRVRLSASAILEALDSLLITERIIEHEGGYAIASREIVLPDFEPYYAEPEPDTELVNTCDIGVGTCVAFMRDGNERQPLCSKYIEEQITTPRHCFRNGYLPNQAMQIFACAGSTFYGMFPRDTVLESLHLDILEMFDAEFSRLHTLPEQQIASLLQDWSIGTSLDEFLKLDVWAFHPKHPKSPTTDIDIAVRYMDILRRGNEVIQRQAEMQNTLAYLSDSQQVWMSENSWMRDGGAKAEKAFRRKYFSSPMWHQLRQIMWHIFDDVCGNLGCSSPATQLHHINYERFGREKPHDVIPLCAACHMTVHNINPKGALGYYVERLKFRDKRDIPDFIAMFHTD